MGLSKTWRWRNDVWFSTYSWCTDLPSIHLLPPHIPDISGWRQQRPWKSGQFCTDPVHLWWKYLWNCHFLGPPYDDSSLFLNSLYPITCSSMNIVVIWMSGFNISRFLVLKRCITWKKLEQNLFFQHSAYLLILKSRAFWFTHISSEFHWLPSCINALVFHPSAHGFGQINCIFKKSLYSWHIILNKKTYVHCLCLPNNNVNFFCHSLSIESISLVQETGWIVSHRTEAIFKNRPRASSGTALL